MITLSLIIIQIKTINWFGILEKYGFDSTLTIN